jgi:hypothetical protein
VLNTSSPYRSAAVRRYLESRERSVLPRFVSPRTALCLWILLGLLVASMVVVWLAQVPLYVSGTAVVTDSGALPTGAALVAFLPADSQSRLRVGQLLYVTLEDGQKPVSLPIVSVEPDVNSPVEVRQRFGISDQQAAALNRPVAVAVAPIPPASSANPPARYVGSTYPVDVAVGSRRVISLLSFTSLVGE